MSALRFKRFTKPRVLKAIGRDLLGRFLEKFRRELDECGVRLPDPDLKDDPYFGAVAALFMSPEGLPGALNDALHAIDEMATEEGQEMLEESIAGAGLDLEFDPRSSREDIALQVWLAAPELLARQHNQQWLVRLASFEYHGGRAPRDHGTFRPHPSAIGALAADLDSWFGRHNRGRGTTRIEPYGIGGECWFLIRHGDTYARTPKVEENRSEIIHYRPEKDDVVVYAPEADEIRIHAGTAGERRLYREKFGLHLFGRENYFGHSAPFTLEPLRLGRDALDTRGVPGIRRIVLRELDMRFHNPMTPGRVLRSIDVFASAELGGRDGNPIPGRAILRRAGFDVYFADECKPRKVEIRPPNVLKLGRHCDARLVHQWLRGHGFRASAPVMETPYAPTVAGS